MVSQAFQGASVPLALQDFRAQLVRLAPVAPPGLSASQGLRGLTETTARLGLQDFPVLWERRANQGHKAFRATQGPLEPRAFQVSPAPQGHLGV